MSRQLARIRTLISEIDEIQKQGQSKARPVVPLAPTESEVPTPSIPPRVAPPPGRIAVTLDANVVLDVCGIVEIKKAPQGLEILFDDGKAFHIPFKDVA
jgi:hypothetical protein